MQVQDFLNIEAASKKVKAMTENQHTLSLLTALTGTGKTTVAAQYLIQNCHDEKARVTFL
ncbi:DEAD/DEAH box helicase family protein [Lactiplantibacillus pentosus]|nr:DEAD/DEAH box helicase family protein [Lactiplantibacillus pentosus]